MLAVLIRKLHTLIAYQDAARKSAVMLHSSSRAASNYRKQPQKPESETETDHLQPEGYRPRSRPRMRPYQDKYSNRGNAPKKINRELYNLGFEGESVLNKQDRSKSNVDPNVEILYGIHPVKLALTSGRRHPIKAFFKKNLHHERIQALRALCQEKGVPTVDVSNWQMGNMVFNLPHQGVCLKATKLTFDSFDNSNINRQTMYDAKGFPEVWLLPYMVKDAMNMGAVLRSAYYFGVEKVLVPEQHSAAASAVVSKASSGALEVMTIQTLGSEEHTIQCLQKWQQEGGRVVGTSADPTVHGAIHVDSYAFLKPTLLIMGNEMSGIPATVMDRCDESVYIDTSSQNKSELVDSLNVSVATGILLHSLRTNSCCKQRAILANMKNLPRL